MNKKTFFLLAFSFLFLTTTNIFAQKTKRKNLEAKRVSLKKEIRKIKTYLDNTKKKERSLSHQVNDLDQKITTRSELISTISDEIHIIEGEIEKNAQEIATLHDELNLLKKDYTALIIKSHKNKSESNRLLFLLSSDSFYQGFQRFQYMKQYTQYRKNQGDSIQVKAMKLQVMNDSLAIMKITKYNLVDEKKHEQSLIENEKEKQEVLVKKYRRKKRRYISQIRRKQAEERKLTKKIENIIKGAIKKSGTKSKSFALSPKAQALAKKFTSNKGKLPWPVEKGLVTVRFGRQADPMNSGVKIESSGVRIATNEGAVARAVFDGKVLAIQKNPQSGILSVLVQHGNYITVYANLESVSISKGDTVKTKETLGSIHTDRVTGKTVLKFQIWKDVIKQNPAKWVFKL